MVWTPESANAELARMRAESEDRSSRGSIRSKSNDDYSDFPGFEDAAPSRRTGGEDDLQKLLERIERRLVLGMEIDARDMDKLIDAGLLELPREYVREGGVYKLSKLPEFRSRAAQEGLGYQPSMTPGGGMAYGSGMGGALTGEDTRRILAMQPTGPTPEQISFVEGARGRIASRMRDEEQYGIGRPSVYDINQELERMRQLGTRARAEKPKESKFERKLRKQQEEDPLKWLTYLQTQKRLSLQDEEFAEKKARQAKVETRWGAISDWIIKHAGNPAYEPYIAKVEDLRKGFVEAVDPLAAIAAIEAAVKTANAQAEKELEDWRAKRQIENDEYDRRQRNRNSDRIAFEQWQAESDKVDDANKNSATLNQEIYKIDDEIAGLNEYLAGLRDLTKSETASDERKAEAEEAIQATELKLRQAIGRRESKQSRLSKMSGFGGTQAVPEGATQTNDFGDVSGYPEGSRARNPNGQIIVVRNGRWVLE